MKKVFVIEWDYADSNVKEFDTLSEAEGYIRERISSGYTSAEQFDVIYGKRKRLQVQWIKDRKYNVYIE